MPNAHNFYTKNLFTKDQSIRRSNRFWATMLTVVFFLLLLSGSNLVFILPLIIAHEPTDIVLATFRSDSSVIATEWIFNLRPFSRLQFEFMWIPYKQSIDCIVNLLYLRIEILCGDIQEGGIVCLAWSRDNFSHQFNIIHFCRTMTIEIPKWKLILYF